MSDPAPTGAFGIGNDEAEDSSDPLSVTYTGPTTEPPPAAAETPAEPAPTEPAPAEPAPTEPAPAEPAAPETPAPTEPAPTEPEAPAAEAEEAARRWAGRFSSPEELERSWIEGQDLIRRQGQRANQAETQLRELETAVRGYLAEQQAKEQAGAQPAAPAQIPEPTDAELASAGMDRETYRAFAPMLQAQVEARVAPLQQTIAAYQAQQQQLQASMATDQSTRDAQMEAEQAAGEVAAFRTAHPEFAQGTDQENQLADLIQRFNAAWTGDPSGQLSGSFEVGNRESLEIAAEALARPVLADLLMVNPTWMDSDKGMELARAQATLIEATNRATTGTQPAAPVQSPHVESGATGVPPTAPEGTPRDAFDEVLEYDRSLRSRSVFAG